MILYTSTHTKLAELPSPVEPDSGPIFLEFIRSHPSAWKELVDLYFSCRDDCDATRRSDASACNVFRCSLCDCKNFSTEKALKSHMRAKQKCVNPVTQYIGDTSVCPACGTDFRTRLRLITHACEDRVRSKRTRVSCFQQILDMNLPPVATNELHRLQAIDRQARLSARKRGRTHEIATLPAVPKPQPNSRRTRLRQKTDACMTVYDNSAAKVTVSCPPSKRRRLLC